MNKCADFSVLLQRVCVSGLRVCKFLIIRAVSV